jgi:hypothetical protein
VLALEVAQRPLHDPEVFERRTPLTPRWFDAAALLSGAVNEF